MLETSTSRFRPGKTVALIGHTGSGKTTLASLVPRFYDVTGGRVTVDGVDVRELTLASLRAAIGVIAQDPFLFSASVRENIAFGRRDLSRRRSRARARLARRTSSSSSSTTATRPSWASAASRSRAGSASAWRSHGAPVDPRILILDDATASVDATTEAQIRSGLREAVRGRTTIVIAHRLSTIALADEIVVLEHGRIAARGSHEQLLGSSAIYREIYEHGLVERRFTDAVEARGAVKDVA